MGILCFNEKKDERSILSSISWYVRHLHRKYLFFSLLFPALMFGQPALANLEEVVVTARKKTESLQDTPISVTALSGDRLEDMGLSRITKLQDVTPNLVFQNTPALVEQGTMLPFILEASASEILFPRSIPVWEFTSTTYIRRSAGAVFDMIDIEQVEILRGRKERFWKEYVGGAISIKTAKPNEDTSGNLT